MLNQRVYIFNSQEKSPLRDRSHEEPRDKQYPFYEKKFKKINYKN